MTPDERARQLFEDNSSDFVVTCTLCGNDFYTSAIGTPICTRCLTEAADYAAEEAACENCGDIFKAADEDAAKFHDDADCVDRTSYYEAGERGGDDGVEDADPRDEQKPMTPMTLGFQKIPSERYGYTVWLMWGDVAHPHEGDGAGAFLIGQVRRREGSQSWRATVDDGRKPNPLDGTTDVFSTRQAAAAWLQQTLTGPATATEDCPKGDA